MRSQHSRVALIGAALVTSVVAAYWSVRGHGFINLDDPEYVFANPHVSRGLSWSGLGWAFTSTEVQNWHPLTWLSHMADVQLFGLDASAHHLVAVALHAANAVVLFLALSRLTGTTWRSAAVAALFALHPLHVESVAWISERKDLLSTLFGLLAIHAWARWSRRGGRAAYVASWLLAGLSLLAKPMLVTLPFLLLLLDVWPLRRVALPGGWSGPAAAGSARVGWRRALLEKVPFALLSLGSAIVTYVAQAAGGAVVARESLGLGERLANATVAYVTYLAKTVWPEGLAAYYPLPLGGPAAWKVAGAAVALVVVTALVAVASRRRPYLAMGWFWYLGTLVPVIGLVQVGGQSHADRYTYVPLIGVFVLAVWGGHELLAAAAPRARLRLAAVPFAALLALLAVLTHAQAATWRDSRTVWGHALAVVPGNWMALTNLGKAAFAEGRVDEAEARFREALASRPTTPVTPTNLGTALAQRGELAEAERLFRQAVALDPAYGNGWYNLGIALLDGGRAAEAVEALSTAVRLEPGEPTSRKALGAALLGVGRAQPASEQYREALRIAPDDVEATVGLGVSLAQQGLLDAAIEAFRRAVALAPDNAALRQNLETALAERGR